MAWQYHGSGAMGARPENRISVGLPRHPWEHPFLSKYVAPRLLNNLRGTQRNKLLVLRKQAEHMKSVLHPWLNPGSGHRPGWVIRGLISESSSKKLAHAVSSMTGLVNVPMRSISIVTV